MAEFIPSVFKGIAASCHSIPRVGEKVHPRSETQMRYVEFNVPNGTQLPDAIPFGVFAEVRELPNSNESLVQLWIADGQLATPSAPVFTERTDTLTKVNEYICSATRKKKIVAPSTAADTGTYVWESDVNFVDKAHSEKVTVETTALGLNTVVDAVFDEQLSVFLRRERVLVPTATAESHPQYPAGLVLFASPGTVYHYITFTEIKCGWYLKTTEIINTTTATYTHHGTINDHWPTVVTTIGLTPLLGRDETGETYLAGQMKDVIVKSSYNGPCKVSVVGQWHATVPAASAPTYLILDGFTYDGLTFDIGIPESLHPGVAFIENINNHPSLDTPQSRVRSYPATSYTDWPAYKVIPQRPRPYKGGYIQETFTIYKPGTA